MKIAFTSQNLRDLTGHAGKTSRFIIYSLNDDKKVEQKEVVELAREDILHIRFHESSEPYAPHPILDVDFLITGGAGNGFVRRLGRVGVQVLITPEKEIENALDLFIHNKLPILPPHNHSHH